VSKSGGECRSRETRLSVTTSGAGGATSRVTIGKAGTGAADSAFTKVFRTCDRHPEDAGLLVLWQHPWAGWCDWSAANSCGQEKQFPQNNATTTSAAMIELETFRILIPLYTVRRNLQQGIQIRLPVFTTGAPAGSSSG
jgi:hypothetical protein